MWGKKEKRGDDFWDAMWESYCSDVAAKFKAFRDVGDTFNYMGVECLVYAIKREDEFGLPRLWFNYVDKMGVIQNMNAGIEELPALIKQNVDKPRSSSNAIH